MIHNQYVIKLEYTESTGIGYRHRTWTRAGDEARRLSALQNQFALSEYEKSEEEALQLFRVWLWRELQDRFNVVSTEMRRLARAHQREEEVEILVPKDAPHGALIVRALLWLAENTDLSDPPRGTGSDPGPTYESVLPDGAITTRAEIEPKYIVWVQGNTQSRMSVIVAYGQAFVPEYGIVPLKQFRWVNRKLAESDQVQKVLNDAFDQAFEAEEGSEPVEYDPAPPYLTADRYTEGGWSDEEGEEWGSTTALAHAEHDAASLVEQLTQELGDAEAAVAIAQTPDIEDWYVRPLSLPSATPAEAVRPAYLYTGNDAPLRVRSAEDQLAGKGFRYAGKEEAQEYRHTHRPQTVSEGNRKETA